MDAISTQVSREVAHAARAAAAHGPVTARPGASVAAASADSVELSGREGPTVLKIRGGGSREQSVMRLAATFRRVHDGVRA